MIPALPPSLSRFRESGTAERLPLRPRISLARMNRRDFLKILLAGAAGAVGLGGYAFAIEPAFRLTVKEHRVASAGWPAGRRPLRIAIVSDIHACEPWMPATRIRQIVERTNALAPDVTVVLGDIAAGLQRFRSRAVKPDEWGPELAALAAPLGVHAVLGNHDWWTDPHEVRRGLAIAGIPLYENDALRVERDDGPLWVAGIADQIAIPLGNRRFRGFDDLPGTLALIDDDAPVVLMVHEPDIFPRVPPRVAITLAGHTHGGQVRLPVLGRPIVPSEYGQRFAYGHICERDRHMVVSGGLGCSIIPVRFMVPPEITLVTLTGPGDG